MWKANQAGAMRQVGVDEAGKGPVLGSMFAAAVVVDPADLPDGVGDSKAIPPTRRETLDAEIRSTAAAVGVAEIPVDRIDDAATDMNSLTVAAHAQALDAAVTPADDGDGQSLDGEHDDGALSGYLDAGDANAGRFERRVVDGVGCEPVTSVDLSLDLTAEHAADATYPVVGAASIVAKVARDAHVEALAAEHGEVGSGYPSDPTTRDFLAGYVADHGELPPCARSSWQTSRDVLAAAAQASLGEF